MGILGQLAPKKPTTFVGSPKELLEQVEADEKRNVWEVEFIRLNKTKVIGVLMEIKNGVKEYLETRLFRTEREGREFVAVHNKQCRKKDMHVKRTPRPESFVLDGVRFDRDGGDPNFKMPNEPPQAVSSKIKEIEDWDGCWQGRGNQRSRFQEEVLEWTLAGCPEAEEEKEQKRKE